MYCPKCGAQLPDDAAFCSKCGAAISVPSQPAPAATPAPAPAPAPSPAAGVGVGFSKLVDSPEVVRILTKQEKMNNTIAIIFSFVPLVVCMIVGIVSEKQKFAEMLGLGAVLTIVFFLLSMVSKLKKKRAKPYTGTVVGKDTRTYRRKEQIRREYITVIRDDSGKDHKEVENSFHRSYDYLRIGERVRFLPQFPYPYEKEDKTLDGEMICLFCSRKTSIYEDRCKHCKNPVIK